MKDAEIIRGILSCAKMYHENLEGKSILLVFEKKNDTEKKSLEVFFMPKNFAHLTGVSNYGESIVFYQKCLDNMLNDSDFLMLKRSTVEMKLSVLPTLMQIHKTARMLGDYNSVKPKLVTDKVVGTVTSCMGFCRDEQTGAFVPNTVLREDTRNSSDTVNRILAIFRKDYKNPFYSECCYTAKGVSLNILTESSVLKGVLDPKVF